MDQKNFIGSDGLSIKFLGTGGAFETTFGNSSAIVQVHGQNLLVDCGHSVFPRLMALDLVSAVDAVLVTHLHDDHVGSLSTLILYYTLVLQKGKLPIYVPTLAFKDLLVRFLTFSLGKPEERVDFRLLSEVKGLGAIDTFGKHVEGMQTYGYYFTEGDQTIVYSGDNGDADFLFRSLQELELPSPTVFHEVFFHFRIAAHAYYQDLMRLSEIYPTYCYHCDPAHAPADNTLRLVALEPRFLY